MAFENPVEETLPISRLIETNVDVIQATTDEPNRSENIEPITAESLTTM